MCDFEYVRLFVVVLCLPIFLLGIANRQLGELPNRAGRECAEMTVVWMRKWAGEVRGGLSCPPQSPPLSLTRQSKLYI